LLLHVVPSLDVVAVRKAVHLKFIPRWAFCRLGGAWLPALFRMGPFRPHFLAACPPDPPYAGPIASMDKLLYFQKKVDPIDRIRFDKNHGRRVKPAAAASISE
jgi:hypothetical protein